MPQQQFNKNFFLMVIVMVVLSNFIPWTSTWLVYAETSPPPPSPLPQLPNPTESHQTVNRPPALALGDLPSEIAPPPHLMTLGLTNGHPIISSNTTNPADRVKPILFVPNNISVDPEYLPAISEALATISIWYATHLSGYTFRYTQPEVVIGQHELRYYCPNTISDTQCIQIPGEVGTGPEGIYNVLSDLASQGYSIEPHVILLIFWVGGYGYAGGAKYSATSGFAAVGDWALDGIAGRYESGTDTSNCDDSTSAEIICTQDAQIGAVAHELGHAFGLPHPTDDGTQPGDPNYWLSTVMMTFWDFPDVTLIDSTTNPEKTILLQHAFFKRGGNPSTRVKPILFVPSNLNADSAYLPAVDEALAMISAWYATQLDGNTFNYVQAEVVTGQHELRHYCPKTSSDTQCIQIPGELGADPEDINNVLSDLTSQGYPVEPNTILLIFWVGGYGYASGAKYSPTSGFAAVGDWALDGIAGKYEAGTATSNCDDSAFAWLICTKNAQIGSVAHELGHAFGLPHPTDDGTQLGDSNYWLSTVMAVPWDFPNVVLIDSSVNPEKTALLQHPFFSLSDYQVFLPVVLR